MAESASTENRDTIEKRYKDLVLQSDKHMEHLVALVYDERDYVKDHAECFADPERCLDHLEYKLAAVHEAMYHTRRCELAMYQAQ